MTMTPRFPSLGQVPGPHLLAILLFTAGCAGKIPLPDPLAAPTVTASADSLRYAGRDSGVLPYRSFRFPGEVIDYEADSLGRTMAVLYKLPGSKALALAVLPTDAGDVRGCWRFPEGSVIVDYRPPIVYLQESKPEQLVLLDIQSGEVARVLQGNFRESARFSPVLIGLDADSLYAVERSTGARLWSRPCRGKDAPQLALWRIPDHLVILRKDLTCVRSADGEGWTVELDTYWRQSSGGGMERVGKLWMPSPDFETLNWGWYSNPLVTADALFLAAGGDLTAFSLDRGETLWSRPIKHLGTSHLQRMDDSTGLLTCYGVSLDGGKWRSKGDPFVSAFRLDTGDEIWRVPLAAEKKGRERTGVLPLRDGCAILDQTGLSILDRSGKPLVKNTQLAMETPWLVVRGGQRLLLVGAKGMAAYAPGEATPRWTRSLDAAVTSVIADSFGVRPIEIIDATEYAPRYRLPFPYGDARRIWIEQEKGVLTAIDFETGETSFRLETGFQSVSVKSVGGYLRLFDGERLGLIETRKLVAAVSAIDGR